jgi:hypothetical protein
MTSPTQTEPPNAALRHSRSLSHKPSQSQRASDLAGYFNDVKAGIGSCAAGLHDSENAYGQVLNGSAALNKNAESVFTYGGANCTLASNQALTDFGTYQVTESLSSLNLDTADNDVITWSFDSTAVQADMLAVLKATTPAAKATAQSKLTADVATLDRQRAAIDTIWSAAKKTTGATAPFPSLPAWKPPSS